MKINVQVVLLWVHSSIIPRLQLCDGAPLSGNNGSTSDGSVIGIDDLIDGGYMIGIVVRPLRQCRSLL